MLPRMAIPTEPIGSIPRPPQLIETITAAFSDYYRTTVLSEETDPNKLHDLKAALDNYQVYSPAQVETLVRLYLEGASRETALDPILDTCVAVP